MVSKKLFVQTLYFYNTDCDEPLSKAFHAIKRTDLTGNDRGPHNQQHQLVEQRVQEPDHRLQLGGVERRNAGLELGLQVVFHDSHVSYPDWKHVLVQSVDQRKELVQVLVLNSEIVGN